MDYFFSDNVGEHNAFVELIPNAVSQKSLGLIERYAKTQSFFEASTVNSENLSNENEIDIRSTLMCWLSDDGKVPDELMSVYEELTSLSRRVNDALWKYNIEGWEPFQYGEYRADKNGHYTWHIDTSARYNGGHVRKLSFSLGLSHRHAYEGGVLEIKYGCKPFQYQIGKGDMVVFPSFLLHRVTPVTKGVRKTLVGWGRGPNFV